MLARVRNWILKKLLRKEEVLDLRDPAVTERIFRLELGGSYRKYWDNLARSKQLAYFAVAGLPFGDLPDDKNIDEHGRQSAEIIIKKLEISKADEVLEVGVGVGRLARHIAQACKSFTGIDISRQMVRFAKKRLADLDNVKIIHHPKSELSLFPDNHFDKVYFQIVLIHLDREDVFHYLQESYRALRPGGLGWFQFYNLLHPQGFKEFRYAVNLSLKLGGKLRGRVQCYTAEEVRKLVSEVGFNIREDKSYLGQVEQKYEFEPPDTDWCYYLIAVGEKPKSISNQG